MKQYGYFRSLIGFSLLILVASCQPTRYLSGEEFITGKTIIKFSEKDKNVDLKKVRKELKNIVPPTNSPFKLWIFNIAGKPRKEKGLRFWLKNKIGEPPRLYKESQVARTEENMVRFLRSKGFFEARIQADTHMIKQKVKTNYFIESLARYQLRNVYWPEPANKLFAQIAKYQERSWLRPGNYYQQEDLIKERNRIAETAGNEGYFRFLPSHIYFYIDTIPEGKELDIYIRIQEPVSDSTFLEPHFINKTIIFDQYNILEPAANLEGRNLFAPSQDGKGQTGSIKFKVLERIVSQREKDPFSMEAQNQSINHLLDLGVFKFVNIKYDTYYYQDTYWLDRSIYLTPALPKHVGVDLDINTRSGNFLGSSLSLYYQNKNAWLGAENLLIRLSGGMETQIGSDLPALNSLEWKVESQLSLPRILLLKSFFAKSRSSIPKTLIRLGNHFQRRPGFFTFNSLNLGLEYNWGKNNRSYHALGLLSISYNQTFQTDRDFAEKLEGSPRLKSSFSDVFIIGSHYQFQKQKGNPQAVGNSTFLRTRLESAGNLLYLLFRIGNPDNPPYTFLQQPFSQFLKADVDYRFYKRKKKSTWVYRSIAGLVIPFGNNTYAPYIKQYFAGGSNDNRAFRLRSIGPGSVARNSDFSSNDYFDQTGELKLGFNLEYRHPLFNYLKGAIFLDGGNIWLLKANTGDPEEAVFKFRRFYKEIGLGTGVGLRLDLNFFVLRVDIAFPIYDPGYALENRWQLKDVQLFNPSWRKQKLLWNIAIGYPF